MTVLGRRLRQYGVLTHQAGGEALWRYDVHQIGHKRWRVEVLDIRYSPPRSIVRDYDTQDELLQGLAQVHQAGEQHGVWRITKANDWQADLPRS